MRRSLSIRSRLLAVFSCLLVLLIAVATYAIVQLARIDDISGSLNEKWLVGTRILGEIAALQTELHVDQIHGADGDRDAPKARAAEMAADLHRRALQATQALYVPLIRSDEERRLYAAFDRASKTYVAASASAAAAARSGATVGAADDRRLDELFVVADRAIHTLIDANTAGSNRDAAAVRRINNTSLVVLIASTAIGLLVAIGLIVLIRKQISNPLVAITRALSGLAAGNTDVRVPEVHRQDEIGDMAKAFEVFRRNASALVQAHREAEAAQKRAQALARHDALTGLPNRRVFAEELEKAIARVKNEAATYAVLLIDLDRFKPVNDIYGHPVGDTVLCTVADRLREAVRRGDTVARLGGDEFAVVTEFDGASETFADSTIRLANRVIAAVSQPILVGEVRVEVGASIGIANCPLDGADTEALLRASDIAMYRAKREGRGTFRFFKPSMDMELRARAALEADLRRAVANGEIRPHYQPLMALAEGRLLGFEVLARWHHPERGVLPPGNFIPLAEEIGLIPDLTFGLLRQACLDARAWPADLMFSLNVSPLQLKDGLLPTRLLAILSETGFPPSRLEIEIAETALVGDLQTVRSVLATLHGLGIRVVLDDFGTAYSSLYRLRELHLDKIKIDRSFIRSIEDDPESGRIVNALLGLTRSLGLPIVAEGIETAAILERVIASGCEFGQGFYFAEPMPAAEALAFVERDIRSRKSPAAVA